MTGLLRRFAATAPVPVYVIAGGGASDAVDRLWLRPDLRLELSPRAANVLLVVGRPMPGQAAEIQRAHDQMSLPRATVWWAGRADGPPPLPDCIVLPPGAEVEAVVAVLRDVGTALLTGARPSSAPVLPDVPPNPWRGVGPYAQGGKGMTGGAPYGRPLASRAKDRDGLELDQLVVRIGRAFPVLPAGLGLTVRLQGEVVQAVEVDAAEPTPTADSVLGARPDAPFLAALAGPVSLAELEQARARHHLRAIARALRLLGAAGPADRVLGLAFRVPLPVAPVARLSDRLAAGRALRWACGGVGVLAAETVSARDLGWLARASGVAEDARDGDPVYLRLGFAVLTQNRGDVHARLVQRAREAEQSLRLVAAARDERWTADVVEGLHGPLRAGDAFGGARAVPLLPELLTGLDWPDAVVAADSLGIELDEPLHDAVRQQPVGVAGPAAEPG